MITYYEYLWLLYDYTILQSSNEKLNFFILPFTTLYISNIVFKYGGISNF